MNNNNLKLTILGSGTCVPSLDRSSCSALVELQNYKILFDCGPGTMTRLLQANVLISEITHIFLSHFHPDHCGELVNFIFSNKYSGLVREDPLVITGGQGFLKFYNGLHKVFNNWIELEPGMLILNEMNITDFNHYNYNHFQVNSMPMNHNPESLAYKITSLKEKSIVYSGDTDYCTELADLAKNANILICESSFPDSKKVSGHLSPSLAGKIAQKAGVKKLILTHFYPPCNDFDLERECQKEFHGEIILAKDLMSFVL